MTDQEVLKFMPFSSCLNPSFWSELTRLKLDEFKLNDDYTTMYGYYNICTTSDLPPIINFDYSSFPTAENETTIAAQNTNMIRVNGRIKIFNTINEFNMLDKNKLLDDLGESIWSDIKEDKTLDDPSLLSRFCLITFANLKSYVFNYWFSFPAITFTNKTYYLHKTNILSDVLDETQTATFLFNLKEFAQNQTKQVAYFCVDVENQQVLNIKDGINEHNSTQKRILFAFYDPNTHSNHPGWPLRNYLALLSLKCKNDKSRIIEVMAFRDRYKKGTRDAGSSLILHIELIDLTGDLPRPVIVGWERNEKNMLQPRMVDLSSSMNKEKLAESAVSLNLKLMKWRIAPDINLDAIRHQKCLLLGSGTLGCNVARCLMGWGVDTITLVDNSKVSYSNPVRQSLFTFQDSISTKDNFKSIRAAENLKVIYPGVNARGIVLNIPMPGHFVGENIKSKVQEDVNQLENQIKEHDCVFLLMDTRESRWLPTVLAAVHKKLVINSALGFDSFLVMRHGVKLGKSMTDETTTATTTPKPEVNSGIIESHHLGCYFCNDIVAPGNSTVDRTLDQQCTVSRPGLSFVASALAVELMASLLQHPKQQYAPCASSGSTDLDSDSNECCLGIIPHQLRGYLHSYSIIMPATQAYDKCTACSNQIIDMYNRDGFEFLMKAFNDSSYLEDITGLTQLKNTLDQNEPDFVIELNDSGSDFAE